MGLPIHAIFVMKAPTPNVGQIIWIGSEIVQAGRQAQSKIETSALCMQTFLPQSKAGANGKRNPDNENGS